VRKRPVDWPAVLWILLIGIAVHVAYGASLRFFFSQDDFVFLARAARIASWGDLVHSFAAADHFYRPLPRVVMFLAQLRLFGLNASAFHLVSLGLHTANAALLFLLCRRLFASTLLAGLSGLLYATHHIPFLAVYWVSGIQDLSMTTLLLMSLLLYLRSVEVQNSLWRVFSLLAYGLALFSKEMAVTFPILVVLVASIHTLQHGRQPSPRRLLGQALGYGALLGAYLVVRSQKATSLIASEGPYAWSLAPRTVLGNLCRYLADVLYVGDWLSTTPQRAVACTFLLALLVIICWRSPRYRRVIVLGTAWFVLTLLPVLFLSQQAYSFYAYFPLAGIAMALATPLTGILQAIGPSATTTGALSRLAKGAVISLLLIAWLWFSTGQIRATEVKDPAGIIAKSVLARKAVTEVQALYPALPPGSTLYVVGLTERDGWALGHGDLFQLYYPQTRVVLVLEGEQGQGAGTDTAGSYVYHFGGGE
jgi:hypothetical protein